MVSGYLKPGDPKKWYDYIVNGEEKKIVDFFEEDNEHIIELIRRDLEKKYTEPNNKKYFLRGFSSFQNEDYMTDAMYLVALIEVRVNELVQFPQNTKYRDKYSNKGFKKVKDDHYNQTSFPIQKKFYFLNVYPSVIKFLARLFVEGKYKFENGIEPPYISRNWLLHGRSSREIERWECIQLLNALDTIENVLGDEKIQKQNDCLNETEGENQWIEKRKSVKRERQHKMRFIL